MATEIPSKPIPPEASENPRSIEALDTTTSPDAVVDSRLSQTRRQLRSVDLTAGLLWLACAAIGWFLLVAVVDHWLFAEGLGTLGRWVMLLLFFVGGAVFSFFRIIRPLLQRVNPIYLAHRIEQSNASAKNSLINFLLLRRSKESVDSSVFGAVTQRAAGDIQRVAPEEAIDWGGVLRIGYLFTALVAIGAVYQLASPKSPMTSIGRALAPWTDRAAPTRVMFSEITPGNLDAFYGQRVAVSAEVTGLDDDETPTLFYTTADGQTVEHPVPMSRPEGDYRYACTIPPEPEGLQQGLSYYLAAGDGRSPTFQITARAPPAITVETIRYDYPAYTRQASKHVTDSADIVAIEGTQVTLRAKANREIRRAEIDLGCDHLRGIPMTVGDRTATGLWTLRQEDDPKRAAESKSYQLLFIDDDGKENPSPIRHTIRVIPDRVPTIRLIDPPGDAIELPVNGRLELTVTAEDPDFGLRSVSLRAEREGRGLPVPPMLRVAIDQPTPQKSYEGTIAIEPSRLDLKPGDEIEYWAEAKDVKTPNANVAQTERRQILIVEGEERGEGREERKDQEEQERQQDQGGQQDEEKQQDQGGQQGEEKQQDQGGQQGEEKQQDQGGQQGEEKQQDQGGQQGEEKQQDQGGQQGEEKQQDQGGQQGEEKQQDQGGQQGEEKQQDQGGQQGEEKQQDQGGQQGEEKQQDQGGQQGEGKQQDQGGQQGEGQQQKDQQGGDQKQPGGGQKQTGEPQGQPDRQQGTSENGQQKPGEPGQNGDQTQDQPGKGDQQQPQGTGEQKPDQPIDGQANPGDVFEEALKRAEKWDTGQPKDGTPSTEGKPDTAPGEGDQQRPTDDKQKGQPGESKPKVDEFGQPIEKSPTEEKGDKEGTSIGEGQKKPSEDQRDQGKSGTGTEGTERDKEKSPGKDELDFGQKKGEGEEKPLDQQPEGKPEEGTAEDKGTHLPDDRDKPSGNQTDGPGEGGKPLEEVQPPADAQSERAGDQPPEGETRPHGKDSEQPVNQPSPDMLEDKQPGDQQGKAPSEISSPDGQNPADTEPGDKMAGGTGPRPEGSKPPTGERVGPDPFDKEAADKKTALALEYLKDQLAKEKPDKDLLDSLGGWSRDDLERFVQRWETMRSAAKQAERTNQEASRRYEEALRSLGLPTGRSDLKARSESSRVEDIRQSRQSTPPSSWRDRINAYQRSIGK